MKLLLDERDKIVAISNYIEYGVWGNVGDISSWKIGNNSYMMGEFYTVKEVDEVPIYIKEGKYFYINGEYILDEDIPNEYKERIETIEKEVKTIWDDIAIAIEEGVNEV